MDNFKFYSVVIIFFAAVVGLGYFAFVNLDSGQEHVAETRARRAERELRDRERQLEALQEELAALQDQEIDELAAQIDAERELLEQSQQTETNEHQGLIDKLQAIRDRDVILEKGDQGSDVRTIQEFLNVFNETSGGVDGDFGNGTENKVEAFQRDQGTSADGGVGPTTLRMMIEWLEENF